MYMVYEMMITCDNPGQKRLCSNCVMVIISICVENDEDKSYWIIILFKKMLGMNLTAIFFFYEYNCSECH